MFEATKDKIQLGVYYICEMLTSGLDCKICACGRGILLGLLVGMGIGGLVAMAMLTL